MTRGAARLTPLPLAALPQGVMHFFGRLSFLVDENAHAVHFFVTALLQLLDRWAERMLVRAGGRAVGDVQPPAAGIAPSPHPRCPAAQVWVAVRRNCALHPAPAGLPHRQARSSGRQGCGGHGAGARRACANAGGCPGG